MWQIWKKKIKTGRGQKPIWSLLSQHLWTALYIYINKYIYIYMNEWCIYISLYYVLCISRWMLLTGGGWGDTPWQCKALWVSRKALYKWNKLVIVVHPKALYNHGMGGEVSSTTTSVATAATVQRHQCAHHTPATSGENIYIYIYIYIIALLPTTTRIWKKLLLNWKCLRAFNQYI